VTRRRRVGVALAVLLTVSGSPQAADAQALRGTSRTITRFVEMRPLGQDTVARSQVIEREGGALEYQGHPVSCRGDVCTFYQSRPPRQGVVLTQEIGFTAWGLGIQGLSGTVLVRGREQLGGAFVPPRADERFEAVFAYAQLDRASFRIRAGRQETTSTLGAPGFDGVAVQVWPAEWLRIEAFGGRSLGRGLFEPRSSALRGLDDARFLIHDHALVGGIEVAFDFRPGTELAGRYHREIFGDRSGLLTERGGVVFRSNALAPLRVDGATEFDLGFGEFGKAHLTVESPLTARSWIELTGRRYMPFFEMWTIWGFFSPVAYREAELRGGWAPSSRVQAWVSTAYRRYSETETAVFGEPLKDRAWRAAAGASWALDPDLTFRGGYEVEGPVGAFLSSGNAAAAWRASDRVELSVRGVAAQQIEEFRIGEGFLLGAGLGAAVEIREAMRVNGGMDLYRHTHRNRPTATDWNQRRGWVMLQIGFGRDAGEAPRSTR
jgi:hypothetical protein